MNKFFIEGFMKTAADKPDPDLPTGLEGLGLIIGGALGTALPMVAAPRSFKALPKNLSDAAVLRSGMALGRNLREAVALDSLKGMILGAMTGSLAGDVLNKGKKNKIVRYEDNASRASVLGGTTLGGLLGNFLADRQKINIKGKNIAGNPEAKQFLSRMNKAFRIAKKPSHILSGALGGAIVGHIPNIIKSLTKKKKKD